MQCTKQWYIKTCTGRNLACPAELGAATRRDGVSLCGAKAPVADARELAFQNENKRPIYIYIYIRGYLTIDVRNAHYKIHMHMNESAL